MTDDELLFFDSMPRMLPIYEAFCQGLADRGLAFTAKVSRTQISLRNRYVFAAVSLPWRKVESSLKPIESFALFIPPAHRPF